MPASRETAEVLRTATIRAAEAVMPLVGHGKGDDIDLAAVAAIRSALQKGPGLYVNVNCEGEKDGAAMLGTGEVLGRGVSGQAVDVFADPVEGTRKAAAGDKGAYSVMAAAERGSVLPYIGVPYMNKLGLGEEAAHLIHGDKINIHGDPKNTLLQVAKAMHKPPERVVVAVLDRERNEPYIRAALELGCQLRLLSGGDLEQGILTSHGDNPSVDVLIGIGGAPETVLQAAAHRAMGRGAMQAAWHAPDAATQRKLAEHDHKPNAVYGIDDLVGKGPATFVATGITDGQLLKGGTLGPNSEWKAGETVVWQTAE